MCISVALCFSFLYVQQSPSGSRPRRRAPGVDFNSAWEDLEGQADLNSRQPWNFAGRPERPPRGRSQIGQWASVRPGSSGSRGSRGSRGSNGRPSSRDRFANAFGQGSRPNSNEHSGASRDAPVLVHTCFLCLHETMFLCRLGFGKRLSQFAAWLSRGRKPRLCFRREQRTAEPCQI